MPLEWITLRGVDYNELDTRFGAREIRKKGIEASAIALNVGLRPDLRVRWDEICLPVELKANTIKEKKRRIARFNLRLKIGQRTFHELFCQIFFELNNKSIIHELIAKRARIGKGIF